MTEQEFEPIYREYRAMVSRVVRNLYKSHPDPEDMEQRVWMRVWVHIGTFRGECSLNSWIFRVTLNEVRMVYRADRARHLNDGVIASLTDAENSEGEAVEQQIIQVDRVLGAVPAKLTVDALLAAIPFDYRQALAARYLDAGGDATNDEAAAAVGCSLSNIKTRVSRGLRMARAAGGR